MKKRRCAKLLAVALIALFSIKTAIAATEELEKAVLDSSKWFATVVTLEERKGTALAMQAYWKNFASRIPNLTPAERTWLEGESKKTGEPLERLFNSDIFAINRLLDTANNCYQSATELVESQNSGQKTEMFYWTKMIKCYTNSDTLYYLQIAKLSNGKADGEFKLRFSNIILNRIIDSYLPSSMSETMGWTLNTSEP